MGPDLCHPKNWFSALFLTTPPLPSQKYDKDCEIKFAKMPQVSLKWVHLNFHVVPIATQVTEGDKKVHSNLLDCKMSLFQPFLEASRFSWKFEFFIIWTYIFLTVRQYGAKKGCKFDNNYVILGSCKNSRYLEEVNF